MSSSIKNTNLAMDAGWAKETSAAEKYKVAEAATRPYARTMIEKAGLAEHRGELNIFDLACGTGAFEAELYKSLTEDQLKTTKVLGGDVNQSMLDYLQARAVAENWTGLETAAVDANNMQLPASTYTHLFVGFAVGGLPPNTLPDSVKLLEPSGFISVSTWAHLAWYPFLTEAVSRLSTRVDLPEQSDTLRSLHKGLAWHDASFVVEQLSKAGCRDVQAVAEEKRLPCGTPRQFAETMYLPLKWISSGWKDRSEEEKAAIITELQEHLETITAEAAEDGQVYMTLRGVVGYGWKA